jgi:hypothetical protein
MWYVVCLRFALVLNLCTTQLYSSTLLEVVSEGGYLDGGHKYFIIYELFYLQILHLLNVTYINSFYLKSK